MLGEFVAEALFAAVACVLAGLALAGAIWGWNRHPAATILAGAAVALVLGFGAWNLRPEAKQVRDGSQESRLAGIAVAAFIVMAVWLLYVATYCTCT